MTDFADIGVSAPVNMIQNYVNQAFVANGFSVVWADQLRGKAEKGSKAANFLGGSLAQYYAVDFQIYPSGAGATLRLMKGNTGLMGGLWGMHKVEKQFNQLVDTLTAWFMSQKLLMQAAKK